MRHEARARAEDGQIAAALLHLLAAGCRRCDSRSSSSLIFNSLALGAARRILDAGDLPVAPILKGFGRRGVVAVHVDDHRFILAGTAGFGGPRCSAVRCPAQIVAGTITSPRISSRAVRSSAARVTFCGLAGSTSISTLNSPVGCSTEMRLHIRPGTTAMPCVTEPSSTQAVATVTAASTPMASWQTCGMKLRVPIAPPCARGGDQRHLRIILARHIAQPIAWPQAMRSRSIRAFNSVSAFS